MLPLRHRLHHAPMLDRASFSRHGRAPWPSVLRLRAGCCSEAASFRHRWHALPHRHRSVGRYGFAAVALTAGPAFAAAARRVAGRRMRCHLTGSRTPGGHAWHQRRWHPSPARRCIPIEDGRVHVDALRPGDLLGRIDRPVLITHAMERWPGRKGWSKAQLESRHGNVMVARLRLPAEAFDGDAVGVEDGNAMYADHVRNAYVPFCRQPEQMRLQDYMRRDFSDYIFEIGEKGFARALCADAFGVPDYLPDLFAADDLTQLTFGMGPANDGVMFHAHTAAWSALMYGEKEWLCYSPDDFHGETYDRLAMLEARALPSAIWPSGGGGAKLKPLRLTQRAGEIIYVPDGWWHATFSLSDTACFGGQRHKDRLPADWASALFAAWPTCGLALSALAKERGDEALFREAIRREPFNLRFTVEYMDFLRSRGEYSRVTQVALDLKEVMARAHAERLLGRAELAAVIAQLSEVLYHTVQIAGETASVALARGQGGKAAFAEVVQTSIKAHGLVNEALSLDPGNPLAGAVLQAIDARARSVNMSQVPRGLL